MRTFTKIKMNRDAIARSVFGYMMFIPFCLAWGVKSASLFSLLGTIYFIFVHAAYDKIKQKIG
jgi:hypothetical protein